MTDKPDKYPDQIFVRNNLTAREELMFASTEISSLKIENGKLLSEIDHLNVQLDFLERSVAVTHEDNIALRKEEMIVQLKKQLKKQIKENLLLKKTNADLVGKMYQLTNK